MANWKFIASGTGVETYYTAPLFHDFRNFIPRGVPGNLVQLSESIPSELIEYPDVILPTAFGPNDWRHVDSPSIGANKVGLELLVQPSTGGLPVLGFQYSLNGGTTPIALSGLGLGVRILDVPAAPASSSFVIRQLTAAGPSPWSTAKAVVPVLADSSGVAQTASFDATDPAGTAGWRPQVASGAVEDLVSYNSLTSGSLGAYTPSIVGGRLIFVGGGAGAPSGAVLNCTGVSGRVYSVTIAITTGRRYIANDAEMEATKVYAAVAGKRVIARQNARLSRRDGQSGTGWLHAANQTQANAGLLTPTSFEGEGPHIEGEFHISSWRGTLVSNSGFKDILFEDQHVFHAFCNVTNVNVRNRATYIIGCTFKALNAVDSALADWSTGYSSTGYSQVRFCYVTGGNSEDFYAYDNKVTGGYTHFEVAVSRLSMLNGNQMSNPYYDIKKMVLAPDRTAGWKRRARIDGVNFAQNFSPFSANETLQTEPHVDNEQVTHGGDGVYLLSIDCPIVFHKHDTPVQYQLLSDRDSVAIGGFRLSLGAMAVIGRTTHALTNGSPDWSVMRRCIITPGPQFNTPTRMPISASGVTATNMPLLGSSKPGQGFTNGNHLIEKCFIRSATTYGTNVAPAPANVLEVDNVYYNGWNETDLANNLYHYAEWLTFPDTLTAKEAFDRAVRPVPASPLAAISPYAEFNIPASGPLSAYTVSEVVRKTPTISGFTITNTAKAAFNLAHDVNDNVTTLWSVFSGPCTDPDQIARGIRWTGSAWEDSVVRGVEESPIGSYAVVGEGTDGMFNPVTIPNGDYYLCAAVFNGPKKVAVITQAFTVGVAAVTPTHVFVVAGQSNAAGRAPNDAGAGYPVGVTEFGATDAWTAIGSRLYHTNGESALATASNFSFDKQFAIDYAAANPGVNIAFIGVAKGGTGFYFGDWNPGNPQYNAAVARINAAMAAAPAGAVLKGILWHQGENDGQDSIAQNAYTSALETFIPAFRSAITGGASVPFVLGGHAFAAQYYNHVTHRTIQAIPNRITLTGYAPADVPRNATLTDAIHYDAASQRALGSRYVTALAEAEANTSLGAGGTITFGATARSNLAAGTTNTATAIAIGAAAANRMVIIGVQGRNSSFGAYPLSVTIGGIAAKRFASPNTGIGRNGTTFFYALVPTGTTADVVVTWSAAVTANQAALWVLPVYGARPHLARQGAFNMVNGGNTYGTAVTTSVEAEVGDAIIAMCGAQQTTAPVGALDLPNSETGVLGANCTMVTAYGLVATAGTKVVTATFGGVNINNPALTVLVLKPN